MQNSLRDYYYLKCQGGIKTSNGYLVPTDISSRCLFGCHLTQSESSCHQLYTIKCLDDKRYDVNLKQLSLICEDIREHLTSCSLRYLDIYNAIKIQRTVDECFSYCANNMYSGWNKTILV